MMRQVPAKDDLVEEVKAAVASTITCSGCVELERRLQLVTPSVTWLLEQQGGTKEEGTTAETDPHYTDQCPNFALGLPCTSGDTCQHAHKGRTWCPPFFLQLGCEHASDSCPLGQHVKNPEFENKDERNNLRNALKEKIFGVSFAVGLKPPSEPSAQTTALTKAPPSSAPVMGQNGAVLPPCNRSFAKQHALQSSWGHGSSSWDVKGTKGLDKGGHVGKGPAAIVGIKRSAESVQEEAAKFIRSLNT